MISTDPLLVELGLRAYLDLENENRELEDGWMAITYRAILAQCGNRLWRIGG